MMKREDAQKKAIAEITKQIRVALVQKELTQRQLAQTLGIPEATMSDWVRHPEKLTLVQWQMINSVLRLDPARYNAAAGFVRTA